MRLNIEATHVSGAGETHRGGRSTNEDALIIEPEFGLYGVLDGMGGPAGEVASRLASEALVEVTRRHATSAWCTRSELLEFAIDHAASVVNRSGKENPAYRGMGCTIVACMLVEPSRIVVAHIGDSRAYLWRDGVLQALTCDHTVAQELIDTGQMATDVAERSEFWHVLTRNLGSESVLRADMRDLTILAGDRLLLCSDGLLCVPLDVIERILGLGDAGQHTAHALIELALRSEASDNVSAVVVDVSGGEHVGPREPRTRAAHGRRGVDEP